MFPPPNFDILGAGDEANLLELWAAFNVCLYDVHSGIKLSVNSQSTLPDKAWRIP